MTFKCVDLTHFLSRKPILFPLVAFRYSGSGFISKQGSAFVLGKCQRGLHLCSYRPADSYVFLSTASSSEVLEVLFFFHYTDTEFTSCLWASLLFLQDRTGEGMNDSLSLILYKRGWDKNKNLLGVILFIWVPDLITQWGCGCNSETVGGRALMWPG